MWRVCAIVLAIAAVAGGCGGSDEPAGSSAPGTPENPLAAQTPEPATGGRSNEANAEPGYDKLLDRQSSKPEARFTPCNLVTRAQARVILGGQIQAPVEAPQGPTCIYRGGESFVTVAVQSVDFSALKRDLVQRRQVEVSGEAAYCGNYGQPMLYLPLAEGRVLSIAGPCDVARRFAVKALPQLDA
jgi:hypothetical protein